MASAATNTRGPSVTRLDDAAHRERGRAQGEPLADADAEPPERLSLDNGAALGEQRGQRLRRRRFEAAIEGIAGARRLQLHQQRAPAGAARHRGQLAHPHHRRASGLEVAQRRRHLAVERTRGTDLEGAAGEGLRLARQRVIERGGEGADGDEGGDPEGDARAEQDEVPPGAAGLPPGKSRGGAHGARAAARRRSPATRPSRSDTTRSARSASASSWVTSSSVVPRSRLSAKRRSTTAAPVAESRLPVGSSASRSGGSSAMARASATRCCSPPESWAG